MIKGVAASRGIAIGRAYILAETYHIEATNCEVEDLQHEILRLNHAIEQSVGELQAIRDKMAREIGEKHAEIFDAHISILEDPTFRNDTSGCILSEQKNAEYAVSKTVGSYCSIFEDIDDEYLKERAADFRDISKRVLQCLSGSNQDKLSGISQGCILVARDLTPSDTANIDKEKVAGIATDLGGRTSHTAIMSRSLEIPAVLGLAQISASVADGDIIIVDGIDGIVIINPSQEELEVYEQKRTEYYITQERLRQLVDSPATTKDNERTVELAINIGSAKDCAAGLKNGAEGVGLFRTEFLYMNRDALPSEEEQYLAYRDAIIEMDGRPVIIRTLDIGGDKHLPYLKMETEMNPFLGMRAIRLCLKHPEIFKSQLRAILRASYHGKVRIMYPMISGVAELKSANKLLYESMAELDQEGVPYDKGIEKGIMVEIPSAAIIADSFVDEVDFFSIGSNDLIQYTLAVDRMNQDVADIYKPLHPAVLRLIKNVIDVSHKAGKWTGMCGEMAGEEKYTPLLVGMGLDEFSMSASSLLNVKRTIRNLDYSTAKRLANEALKLTEPAQVTELLRGYY